MPQFVYRAVESSSGKQHGGKVYAASEATALVQIRSKGLMVTFLKEIPEVSGEEEEETGAIKAAKIFAIIVVHFLLLPVLVWWYGGVGSPEASQERVEVAQTREPKVVSPPAVVAAQPTTAVSLTDPVSSWDQFVQEAKARASAAEQKRKQDNPDEWLSITFISDDVKKTDSLKSPFRGELVITVAKRWPDLARQSSIKAREQEARFYAGLLRAAIQSGVEASAISSRKKLDEVEKEISQLAKQPSNISTRSEITLRFMLQNELWVFSDGEGKVTDSSAANEKGNTWRLSELPDFLKQQ